jgi:hypothetical protein
LLAVPSAPRFATNKTHEQPPGPGSRQASIAQACARDEGEDTVKNKRKAAVEGRHRPLPLVLALAAFGLAASAPAAAEEQGWSFGLTPYLWLSTIDGSVTGDGGQPDVPLQLSAEDVVSQLDFAMMLSGEARNGRYGLLFDFLYVNLETSTPTPFGALWDEANVDTQGMIGSAAFAYRVFQNRPSWIDLYAGVRVLDLQVDATLEPGLLGQQESSLDKTLIDPLVGARTHIDIMDGIGVSAAFDVGGFGVGTDLTWQVLGTVDYAFNDWISLRIGYRHMSISYSNDSSDLDLNLSGPIIGTGFRF